MKKKFSVNQIALKLICVANKVSEHPITNLKLQKVLYFAQAYHLAIYDKELFPEELEAWALGPVCREIYHRYKNNVGIKCFIEIDKDKDKLPSKDRHVDKFIKQLWSHLGHLSAFQLVWISHSQDPWKNVYEMGKNNRISKESMKIYFRKEYQITPDV